MSGWEHCGEMVHDAGCLIAHTEIRTGVGIQSEAAGFEKTLSMNNTVMVVRVYSDINMTNFA